ncbi:MAG TPA: FAD-dependent monooxygenase, partial [Vicinamibacteria bacterium]|nr:FAD-dependent monooxygenase [Vicinamibacteria bacterium]
AYWFTNFPRPEPERGELDDLDQDAWMASIRRLHENDPAPIRTILQAARHALGAWPLYDMPALDTWHTDRVCLIGDAAHAVSPSTGQGASLAIEDAAALAHWMQQRSRERGYDEEIVEAISSHADYMKIPRDTPLKKAIYACDELVGFIGACVKVRPSKSIHDLPVESVVKKFKDKAFARSVDRAYIYGGAEAVARPIEEHVGFIIEALKPVAEDIGLQGTPPAA